MQSYIKEHGIEGLKFEFLNNEAMSWYDPLKPYTLLEYEWVLEYIDFAGQVVFDAGSHHGNYAVVFKGASTIVCFEKERPLESYILENLKLNKISGYQVYIETLSAEKTTSSLTPLKPDVFKMDIEGAEFQVLPIEILENPQVHTWIVEIHPNAGNPNDLAKLFDGFELLKVDRAKMMVRPYVLGEAWSSHATLIANKRCC